MGLVQAVVSKVATIFTYDSLFAKLVGAVGGSTGDGDDGSSGGLATTNRGTWVGSSSDATFLPTCGTGGQ